MLRFEVLTGQRVEGTYEPESDVVLIGAGDHVDVRLDDPRVLREHAVVVLGARATTVRHVGTTSETRVQSGQTETVLGDPNAKCELGDGDVLVLASADGPRLRVRLTADAEPDHVLEIRSLSTLTGTHAPAERQQALLTALARLHGTVTDRVELPEVLAAACDAALSVVPRATHATVVLRDPLEDDDAGFVPVLTHVRSEDGGGRQAGGAVRVVRSVFRKVVRDRAAVVIADTSGSELSSESLLGAGIMSTIGVPMWRGEQIIGVLQLDSRDAPAMFDTEDVDTLAVLSWSATLAVTNARLIDRLERAEERLASENVFLKTRTRAAGGQKAIIGSAPRMRELMSQIDKVAATRAAVLIQGETGSGKELVAAAVHDRSPRRDRLFVAQNCAALPAELLESELFGHRRGAFTGATEDKKGLFELADGGTLFLDEIGEMPPPLQAKLLRVLQDGEIRRVGASQPKRVDVRVVSATNRDLEREVAEGRFREDLYYRLAVFPLAVPPLRARPEDIPELAEHFLSRYQKELGKPVAGIAEDALELLRGYDWPGNVRELENEIQRLVIQAEPGGFIASDLLSPRVRKMNRFVADVGADKGSLKERVEHVERHILTEVLRAHDNNKTAAAKELGITREGLHKKLKQLGIA